MFSLGTCDHFISLKRQYPLLYKSYGYLWSLKEYGSLFIFDIIKRERPTRILEFGPGFNVFFSDHCKELGVEYVSADISNEELGVGKNDDRFQNTVEHRKRNGHKHLNCLLGEIGQLEPENSFDLIFSISVVEHISKPEMFKTVKEAKSLLKDGGKLTNTIDVYPRSVKHSDWHEACLAVDLEVPAPHSLNWAFDGAHTTFLEQQEIRYVIYNSLNTEGGLDSGIPYSSQFATVRHSATVRK